MRICFRCVLPETFPGISFDEEGICKHCRASSERDRADKEKRRKFEQSFLERVDQIRGKSAYDCLLAYSGGKDSSYLLDILVNQYRLKVLAVTFDNWFLSSRAFDNIRAVTKSLDVSHIFIRPPYELMRRLFSEASRRELYPRKTLERASTICTTCISFVRFSCLGVAIEKQILLVAFAFLPGQISSSAALVQTNCSLLKKTQAIVYNPISAIVGDEAKPFFLGEQHLNHTAEMPCIVNPFGFIDYWEEAVYARIKQLGWQEVSDTDANSTNCLLNSYANLVHFQQYGFHPYAGEVAGMVRKGILGRDEGLRRAAPPEENELTSAVRRLLAKSPAQI